MSESFPLLNIVITLLFVGPAFYFSYKKPLIALTIIIIGLPTFLIRWNVGFISFNTLDLLIFGSTIFIVLTHTTEVCETIKKNKWLINVLISITLIALAALAVSHEKIAAAGILKSYFIGPLLFLILTTTYIKNRRSLVHILCGFSILAFATSAVAILQIWYPAGLTFIYEGFLGIPNTTWQGPENFRATSFLTYPNAIGLLLAPIIPLLIYLHTQLKHRWIIILHDISILFSFAAIYLAGSKGAIIALVLTAAIVGAYLLQNKLKYILLAILAVIIVFPPSLDTLITKIGPGSYSAQLRFIQWQETIELLRNNYLAGAGLAGFSTQIIPYHTFDYLEIFLYPHNIILNFWVELGLVGMLVFMTYIFYSLFKNIKLLKKERAYALTGIAALLIILIHGIVDVPYFKNDLAVVFWFLWSWPFLMNKERWLSG